MEVLTGERMKKVDEDTIARYCPGHELMERAGRQVAEVILERFPAAGFKASILVGSGNNGGDALVAARYLADEGRACSLHYLKDPSKLSGDSLKNYERLRERAEAHSQIEELDVTGVDGLDAARKDFVGASVIVDGLFGTGLSRPVEGRAAEVIEAVNENGGPVVSIDIPSGIHADNAEVLGVAVRADLTVTMGYPKLGMMFHPGRTYVGEMIVADLEFPEDVLKAHSLGVRLLDREEAALRLPARAPDVHKYRVGTLVVVAGSRAYAGAAMLTAEAAMRSGCGMVYAVVPESIRGIVQTALREVVTVGLPETSDGTLAANALDGLSPYLEKADAVVVGPGLGRHAEITTILEHLVSEVEKPLIVDADGIYAFSGSVARLADRQAPLVMTPHSGELKRLLNVDLPIEPLARIEATGEAGRELGAVLVHKGAPTVLASAHGETWINASGDSALATAGTGDVLAGVIGGMIAQGASPLDGACVGCHVQGRAGELAGESIGRRAVIAGDVLAHVGWAIEELE